MIDYQRDLLEEVKALSELLTEVQENNVINSNTIIRIGEIMLDKLNTVRSIDEN